MKKLFSVLLVILLIPFLFGIAGAAKTWKGMNLEDCVIVGGLTTENGTVVTSDVNTKTASYSLTASDTGKGFDNYGATGAITYTLPAWALGLQYTFTLSDSYSVIIDAPTGARILRLTNADADSIAADLAGESVTLTATGISTWVPREIGTWVDYN